MEGDFVLRGVQTTLDEVDLRVYQFVLRRGYVENPDSLAAVGLEPMCVGATLERLTRLGLLRREGPHRLVPVNPEIAAAALILPIEHEILQRKDVIFNVRRQFDDIMRHYASDGHERRVRATIEHLASQAEMVGALKLAAESCQEELLSIRPGSLLPGFGGDPLTWVASVLERDVRVRLVDQHRIRGDLPTKSSVKRLVDAGATVQTTNQSPKALAVFDRRVAFILNEESAGQRAVLVCQDEIVQFVCDVFEQVWQSASPYNATETGYEGVVDDIHLAIMKMLAEGMTDEAVARRLGISVRACRRHVAALFRNLNSVSRFQAGVRAASTGLIGTK